MEEIKSNNVYTINLTWFEKYKGSVEYKSSDPLTGVLKELENDTKLTKKIIDGIVESKDDTFINVDDKIRIVVVDKGGRREVSKNAKPNDDIVSIEKDMLQLLKGNIKEKYNKIKKLESDNKVHLEKISELEGVVKDVKAEKDELTEQLEPLLNFKRELLPLLDRLIDLSDNLSFLKRFLTNEDGLPYDKFKEIIDTIEEVYKGDCIASLEVHGDELPTTIEEVFSTSTEE